MRWSHSISVRVTMIHSLSRIVLGLFKVLLRQVMTCWYINDVDCSDWGPRQYNVLPTFCLPWVAFQRIYYIWKPVASRRLLRPAGVFDSSSLTINSYVYLAKNASNSTGSSISH